jgi:hypothetical protein
MGNRSYIQINADGLEVPVLLYGHWSGTDNLLAVQSVLEKTARIGDVSYLTAELFYEFAVKLGSYDGSLSFGIEQGHIDDKTAWVDSPSVYVDADTGIYTYDGVEHKEFAISEAVEIPKPLSAIEIINAKREQA